MQFVIYDFHDPLFLSRKRPATLATYFSENCLSWLSLLVGIPPYSSLVYLVLSWSWMSFLWTHAIAAVRSPQWASPFIGLFTILLKTPHEILWFYTNSENVRRVKLEEKSSYVVVWKEMVPKGSGTIRRCGLVGVGMALLEEVCYWGGRPWGLLFLRDAQCHSSFPVACGSRCRILSYFSTSMSVSMSILPWW